MISTVRMNGALLIVCSLSVDVLQGFTCSRVQKFDKTKTKGLISACRKRKNVKLTESQVKKSKNLFTFIFNDDRTLTIDKIISIKLCSSISSS